MKNLLERVLWTGLLTLSIFLWIVAIYLMFLE